MVMTPDEAEDYEALRLQGKLSTADAELTAICKRRGWIVAGSSPSSPTESRVLAT